ncbi:MAG TPA: neutral zinc metallopeptidase [Solirubrobacterales bacterium]|nr:neutral zinc metallopeptidase [Solirubrobacterales bacterium]
MKWKRSKRGANRDVIDARGSSPSAGGGGGLPIPGNIAGLGGGAGLVVVLVIVAIQIFGGGGGEGGFDIGSVLSGAQAPGTANPVGIPPEEDPQRDLKDFSAYVFNDVQDTWAAVFRKDGERYEHAQLYLYANAVRTNGCGSATSAVGPFYCPADRRVYLDLSFYEDMSRQLNAPGDFAWAYVIAHEVGHHIQNLLGTNAEVDGATRDDPDQANELSVRLELQADCYAGVWAATVFAEGDLEPGDIDEAFTASEAVGDDRLQRQAGRQVNPDSFTHGTSAQRHHWFETGYSSGDPEACDTFSVDEV